MKRLVRNKEKGSIGGVAAGLADYLNMDTGLVRVLFILLALINGLGVVIYLVMWILVPAADHMETGAEDVVQQNINEIGQRVQQSLQGRTSLAGLLLIALGAFFLLRQLVPWVSSLTIPLLLIGLGGFILYTTLRKQ
ncbi:MAG: PspC domain-containing protein [Chloroflexi bacterium]|nr:PspC domain-containing protein [Chloroflexota bacterium]